MDLVEHKHNNSEARHPWELARLEVIYNLIHRHLPDSSSVLDVGCGDTYVLSELQKKMPLHNYYAIDTAFTDAHIRDFSKEGMTLYKNLKDLEGDIEKAKLILLMDVIEHIDDDKAFLMDLLDKDYIDKESLFLITVPAYQSLYSSHDDFLLHYRRYAPKQLKQTLKDSGFEILDSGNFFTSLLAPRLLSVAKEKIVGKTKAQGLASWQGSEMKSNLLKEVLLLDFKTTNLFHKMGVKFPGLSTYALCRKSVS